MVHKNAQEFTREVQEKYINTELIDFNKYLFYTVTRDYSEITPEYR